MTQYQKKSATLYVSKFNADGWWLGNQQEHVAKGTALGFEFTTNIYTPSEEGRIGKYDRETDIWKEVKNNALTEYYDENGLGYIIGVPDGTVPDWGIIDAPPEYDKGTHTVLYKDGSWKISKIQLGKKYYDENGNELTISTFNFELPDKHSFTAPPKHNAEQGEAVKLIDGKWFVYIKCSAYLKADCSQSIELADKSLMPKGYTLFKPKTQYDEWVNGKWVTNLANKYIAEFNQTDTTRSNLYAQYCDPLMNEARIKRLQGKETEANALETQAIAARKKIIAENPWPVNPEA